MAAKKPDKAKAPESKASSGPAVMPTSIPGVFKNRAGEDVDSRGVLIALTDLIAKDRDHTEHMLETAYRTPAEFLKAMAFDPRLSLYDRRQFAKDAAPYFSPKLTALDIFSTLTDDQLNALAQQSPAIPALPLAAESPAPAARPSGGDGPPRAKPPTSKQTPRTVRDSGRPKQAKPRPRSKP